jgi:RNA polymerase sigma-70 factor (family 1)
METGDTLLRALNENDKKAFKVFFESFYPAVSLFASRYLNNANLAEDIAQETFIEFWHRKGIFTDFRAIKAFLYTVARNKCLNLIKQQDVRENILKEIINSDDLFYELILEEETFRIVHLAISKLAPQTRNVIRLTLDGKMNQEIADHLSISINTVKTLKKNAYKELRIQLQGQHFILLIMFQLLQ